MASRKSSAHRIVRAFPPQGALQRFTLDRPMTLRCILCQQTSMSDSVVTVAGNWSRLLCSRCYGQPDAVRRAAAGTAQSAKTKAPSTTKKKPSTAKKPPTAKNKPAPAPPTYSEPPPVASPLPRDMMWLASLHRTKAEGTELSPAEEDLLRRRAGQPAAIAAARYAEHLVDTEARLARLAGDSETAGRLHRTRDQLSNACHTAALAFRYSYQAELTALERPPAAPEGLEITVMRTVAADPFNEALARVLRRRGLPPHALERPTEDLWGWLDAHETTVQEPLTAPVERVRQMNAAKFVRTALDDVNGRQAHAGLAHLAVAEQWMTCADEIMSALGEARDSAETELRRAEARVKTDLATRLRQAGEAYARGSALCLEARLVVDSFHLRIARLVCGDSVRQLRTDCLAEALMSLAETHPRLTRVALEACREHRAGCADADAPDPCPSCAPTVAEVVRQRRTRALTEPEPAPRVRDPQPATVEKELPPPKPPVKHLPDDNLVCPTVLKQPPKKLVVVAETFSRGDGWFGYGWVDRSGRTGQGNGRAVNKLDEVVQALCRVALDLGTGSNVHLVTRHARAANVIQLSLSAGRAVTPLDTTLSAGTRRRLHELVAGRRSVTVSVEPCSGRHGGSVRAEDLAQRAGQPGYATGEQKPVPALVLPSQTAVVEDRLTGPDDEDGPARWLDVNGRKRAKMSWMVALHRAHLDAKWCPLPDGLSDDLPGRQLRLHLDHEARSGSSFARVQRVALRRRDGRWEIAGIQWPAELSPGTLVTVTVKSDPDVATVRTTLLPRPERIDGVQFAHQYDPRVVTRQNGPGADARGRVPDLTDMSWVLHTLRKLGYLTEDGGAILAEDALVQNCLRLGLPPKRAKGIHQAVQRLVADRALQRVEGSVDPDDRPWHPPRPEDRRVPLLRYVPRVEKVTAPRETSGEWHPHRRGHQVAGHLRRLPPGAEASPESEEEYLEEVRDARIVGRGLPKGVTYVKSHYRKR
ncbi:hypothetical protein M2302_005265 [Micromonospora sp. A200]|uniref:hypothetical protein n=1 Tax=Micromonospora sp. A200 TaxID=2940568 RepID=UPI0024766569|nr:hypothetical protein [Micromonospora sp. A200]MDH6465064.1 hypothetical protein [Micromonospora sp. A200]